MGKVVDFDDAASRTAWETRLDLAVRAATPLLDDDSGLVGGDLSSLVIQRDETLKGGKQVTINKGYQLEDAGVGNYGQLIGHEKQLDHATDTVKLGVLRQAVSIDDGGLTDQYVAFDTAKHSQEILADWAADRLDFSLHLHAGGIGVVTDDRYRLYNTIDAINSTYLIRPNGKAAGALTSADTFDVDLVKDAVQFVKQVSPKIRPASTPWGEKFCLFLAHEQVRSLEEDDSSWFAAMKAALQGGNMKSGVFTRVLGEFDDVLLFAADHVPPGLNSGETAFKASTRRAWLGGAGALSLVFGRGWRNAQGFDINRWAYIKESRDFDENRAIGIRTMVGANRNRFTKPGDASAKENGIVVIETYADHGQLTSAEAFAKWTAAAPTISIEA